jgi:hypothetical protein
MTHRQLLRHLNAVCLEHGSRAAYAREIGISPQFISNVLSGTRQPSKRLLKALGLVRIVRKTISYEPIKDTA